LSNLRKRKSPPKLVQSASSYIVFTCNFLNNNSNKQRSASKGNVVS
jgi:hypothetical protein